MKTSGSVIAITSALAAAAAFPIGPRADDLQGQEQECAVTPLEDLLPDVMAPMAGRTPIWVVDGSYGNWQGPSRSVKTAWVVERVPGRSVLIEGKKLGTDERVRFLQRDRVTIAESLQLEVTDRPAIIPGGATPKHLQRFAFFSSQAFYSAPGCWELTASIGQDTVRVVLELAAP